MDIKGKQMARKKILKVSIIIPVYNVEDYLAQCVDSVISQTYNNLEIILVDDGSTDGSPKICDEYVKNDDRVKVHHKPNGGLSSARNCGLKLATGSYVAFIDSDDYVDKEYIETLLREALLYNASISVCGYREVNANKNYTQQLPVNETTNKIDAIRSLLIQPDGYKVVTWNKLYDVNLFMKNNIEFPPGKIHEDNYTTYKLMYFSENIVYINRALYNYRQRNDSIMGQPFTERRLEVLEMYPEAICFFKKNNLDMTTELEANKLLTVLGLFNDYIMSKKNHKLIEDRILSELRGINGINANSYISAKHRTMYRLALLSPGTYKLLWNMFNTLTKSLGRENK